MLQKEDINKKVKVQCTADGHKTSIYTPFFSKQDILFVLTTRKKEIEKEGVCDRLQYFQGFFFFLLLIGSVVLKLC